MTKKRPAQAKGARIASTQAEEWDSQPYAWAVSSLFSKGVKSVRFAPSLSLQLYSGSPPKDLLVVTSPERLVLELKRHRGVVPLGQARLLVSIGDPLRVDELTLNLRAPRERMEMNLDPLPADGEQPSSSQVVDVGATLYAAVCGGSMDVVSGQWKGGVPQAEMEEKLNAVFADVEAVVGKPMDERPPTNPPAAVAAPRR